MVSLVDFLMNSPGFAGGTPMDALKMGRRLSPGSAPISSAPVTSMPSVFNTPQQNQGLQPPNIVERISNRLNAGLSSPLGMLSANLLANSGPSLLPQSTLSNIGRAGIATQEGIRQQGLDDLQRQLIESQIGVNQAPDTTNRNVQSTFQGENGNMFIVTRDGRTVDTEVPFRKNNRFIENADGSIDLFGPDGELIRTVRSQDTAVSQETVRTDIEADRAGEVREATDRAAAEVSRETDEPQRIRRAQSTITRIERIGDTVDRALGQVSGLTTGIPGAVAANIPGTSSRDLVSNIETIKANLGFEQLQQMREASPTGGALGQVAVQELNALQATIANLDPKQSEDQLRTNLELVKEHLTNWSNAVNESIGQTTPSAPIDVTQMSDEELEAIIRGDQL